MFCARSRAISFRSPRLSSGTAGFNIFSCDDPIKNKKHATSLFLAEFLDPSPDIRDTWADVRERLPEVRKASAEVRDECAEVREAIAEVNNELPEVREALAEVSNDATELRKWYKGDYN